MKKIDYLIKLIEKIEEHNYYTQRAIKILTFTTTVLSIIVIYLVIIIINDRNTLIELLNKL